MWAVDTVSKNSVLPSSLKLVLKTTAHHTFLTNKHFKRRNLTTAAIVLSTTPPYQARSTESLCETSTGEGRQQANCGPTEL